MTRQEIFTQIKEKTSYLCVGLDTDNQLIPEHLKKEKDPVFEFNRQIVEATSEYCVSYKLNLAFYEAQGIKGWESMQKTLEIIPKNCFVIADSKRGDIGNTSALYARTFFETFDFDAVTVAPYMGEDSVKPFLGYENKWVIVLGLTSNTGSKDFQMLKDESGKYLYEQVLEKVQQWASSEQLMFVIGATQPQHFAHVRSIAPNNFFLVPGVGAQGGDLQAISANAMTKDCGLLVNSSRGIIYADKGKNFASAAGVAAKTVRDEMKTYLEMYL